MIYGVIAISVLCLTVKGYCGKRTSCLIKSTNDAFIYNLLRMLFCIAIVSVFVLAGNSQSYLHVEWEMLAICLLAGVTNVTVLVGWFMIIRRCSLVSVNIGTTLGSIVPAVMCAFVFGESISPFKMLGFSLVFCATLVLASGTKTGGGKRSLLLPLVAVADGMSSFAQQLYKQFYTETGDYAHGIFYPKNVYHFYNYVFTAFTLVMLLAIFAARSPRPKRITEYRSRDPIIPTRAVFHIFVMAVCLFAANYLQTVAASDYGMTSQVLYPFIRGGCLITVNITAVLFGEKFTLRSAVGSLVALGGIVIMSVL